MYNVDSSSKGATYFFQMNRHFVQYFQLCNHFQPFMFLHLSVETFFRVLLLKKTDYITPAKSTPPIYFRVHRISR
jgi:hypothetical protein